jgi:PAS domain S-box-containing protein
LTEDPESETLEAPTLLQGRDQLSLALEAAGAGAWEWNIATDRAYWSASNYRLLGLEPGSGASDYDTWMSRVHPDDREHAQREVTHALEERGDLDFVYRCVWPDGTIHWIRDIGRMMLDENSEPRGMYGIQIDVTEQQMAEERIRRGQRMEAIGRVAAAVAHDFNNLLTVIRGYSGLLDDLVPRDGEGRHMLAEIESAGERAAALTEQLLALGQRQILRPENVGLNERITGLGDLLRTTLGEGMELDLQLSPHAPVVAVDPRQLDQALVAVMVHLRDRLLGAGRVTISTSEAVLSDESDVRDAQRARYGVVTIRDSGPSLTPEELEHLFDPLAAPTVDQSSSTFGLAAVYGIVRQSDGRIVAASSPDGGTTISLSLPIGESADGAEPALTAGPPELENSPAIVLVEDEASIRRLFVTALEAHGYTVDAFASAEDATEKIAEDARLVGLLVTDVILPGATGPELAEGLTRRNPRAKVVFMTGYGHEVFDRLTPAARSFPILHKPFSVSELLATVERAIGPPRPAASAPRR